MGINSQGVAYNFGQLGSALLSGANNTLTAPEGQVIVAITFLGNTADAGALSALTSSDNTNFVNHDASAHSTGTYTRTVAGATSSSQDVVFAEENAGTGNNDSVVVGDEVYVTSTGVSLGTVSAINVSSNTKKISFSASATSLSDAITITFVKPNLIGYKGVGGMTLTASHKFPAGTTIYGRWDSVSANDADDLLIVYFGE
jgi:hypothetical protein